MKRVLLAMLLLCAASAQAAPVRKTLVLAKGQRIIHTASGSVITVNTAPLNLADKIVRVKFDQYGEAVSVEALAPGEVKLMLEYTDGAIGEVVNVLVTDKGVVERHRFVASSIGAMEGMSQEAVHATPSSILVAGELYSAADYRRCASLQSAPAKAGKAPAVICGARLRSSAAAVFPDGGYPAAASAEIREEPVEISGGTRGLEGESRWRATVRVGDVPVLEFASTNRASVVGRAARAVSAFNSAAAEWKKNADAGRVYPATFAVRRGGNAYAITMTWKFEQGSRGGTIAEIAPDDVVDLGARSGGGAERLLQWWAATLHDAFRLYYMANTPMKTTQPGTDTPLILVYRKAVELNGAQLDRSTAPLAVARAYTALRWSTGADPFAAVLTTIPSAFQPDPVLAQERT